jgi:hypothetical protein
MLYSRGEAIRTRRVVVTLIATAHIEGVEELTCLQLSSQPKQHSCSQRNEPSTTLVKHTRRKRVAGYITERYPYNLQECKGGHDTVSYFELVLARNNVPMH